MNSIDVKTALENNLRVTKIPLLKMAIELITDLERENIKLKEKLADVQMQKAGEKSDLVWKLKTANEQKTEQLAKAKEIIRKYYKYNPSCEYSYDDIDRQAELFLQGYKENVD